MSMSSLALFALVSASVPERTEPVVELPRVTCDRREAKCERPAKPVVVPPLKGARESTRLPDTARVDARGGVFI